MPTTVGILTFMGRKIAFQTYLSLKNAVILDYVASTVDTMPFGIRCPLACPFDFSGKHRLLFIFFYLFIFFFVLFFYSLLTSVWWFCIVESYLQLVRGSCYCNVIYHLLAEKPKQNTHHIVSKNSSIKFVVP